MNNLPLSLPQRRTLTAPQALWLNAAILTGFLAASSVPSPLYALYRELWGFSPLMLTVVFGSYAIAMLVALLVFGALSDFRGRREVVLASLVLEIGSLLLFWRADSVGWLLAARIVQGLATGIATGALGAGLVDLHRERGPLINSVAPLVGLGLGGLGSSLLVQFGPAPTRLVFDVLLLVFVVLLVGAVFLPETAAKRSGALRSLVPSIAIPRQARSAMLGILPVNTALWAMGGFYLSLGPTLGRTVTGIDSPLVGGVMIASFWFCSAVAVGFSRRLLPRAAVAAGSTALGTGVLVTLAGMQWPDASVALAGNMISGAGFGSAFSGALRTLVPLAQPHERAGLVAGFYVACYLAFSIPAIAAGLLAGCIGLHATALAYGFTAAALAFVALLLLPRTPRAT
jgi:MFS family permease